MRDLAFLLRVLIITAFAVGLGLPLPAVAQGPAQQMTQMDHSAHSMKTPMDEACRAHCIGVSLLVAPVVPQRPSGAVVAVFHAVTQDRAVSLWPKPPGRPPRI